MEIPATPDDSFAQKWYLVLFYSFVFFLVFTCRVSMSPLLAIFEKELGFSHAGSGWIFFEVSAGNFTGLFLSNFISARIMHRRNIALSCSLAGLMLMCISRVHSIWLLHVFVYLLGTGSGLYLPSGISAITTLVRKQDWGKTVAIHSQAPTCAFLLAPIIIEGLLLMGSWRTGLVWAGCFCLVIAALFFKFGRGADFYGTPPTLSRLGEIFRESRFWLLLLFFGIAIGGEFGPYTMLPLFFKDLGYSTHAANHMLALSRILPVFLVLAGGVAIDRLGSRKVLTFAFIFSGIFNVLLGLCSGIAMIVVMMIQPIFPALIVAAVNQQTAVTFKEKHLGIAIAFLTKMAALIGIGIIPVLLGYLGDMGLFRQGFAGYGLISFICLALIPFLYAQPASAAQQSE